MKHILLISSLLIALLIAPIVVPTLLPQAQAANPTTPLVIIRFNQARVSFERQLYGAIQKAAAIKPTLRIDLVSFIPVAQGAMQQKLDARADQNMQSVLQSLAKMGVTGSRVNLIRQYQQGILSDEVHVFVK